MKNDGFAFLVNNIHPRLKFWASTDGTLYVDGVVKERPCAFPVGSPHFIGYIYDICRKHFDGAVPRPDDVQDYRQYVVGVETSKAEVRFVGLRVLSHDDRLYYNMGGFGADVVEFHDGVWNLTSTYPVRFVVGQSQLRQLMPTKTLRTFKELLSAFVACSARDLMMLEAWCIGCFLVNGPYPVLVFSGEQGSAKSTTTRLLSRTIDPCGVDMRRPPKDERDLAVACYNSHVIALDNISTIRSWLSDALCSIATGTGSIGGRKLYTDFGDASVVQARPVVLNGIPDFVEREDLADRSIGVKLDPIPPSKRRDDESFWREFNAALPELLGALFNRVAVAWRDFQRIKVENLPRMSNWARFVAAAFDEQERKEFFDHLRQDAEKTAEHMLEDDILAQSIFRMLAFNDFEGSSLRLIGHLREANPLNDSSWKLPDTPKRITSALTRLKPVLRKAGVVVDLDAGYEPGTRRKLLKIYKSKEYVARPFVTVT